MAIPNFSGTVANIYPAAFLGVYIRVTGGADYWQTLGSISSGVLNLQSFSVNDSLARNKSQGAVNFTAKCNMLQASLTELELLDSICNGQNDFLFKTTTAGAIPAPPDSAATTGWIEVSASQVGCKAKVVCDGDPSNDMHIELDWQGSILLSAYDSAVNPTIGGSSAGAAFASSAQSGSTYYAIGTYTASYDGGSSINANIKPCGISSITLADNAGGGTETISPISNVKMSYEFLATTDGIRRFLPNSLDINLEYDWLATKEDDLQLLDSLLPLNLNIVVTMLNGRVFTLNNLVGVESNYEISGDMDKARVLRFTHKGKILQSSFDGIVS